MANLVQVLGPQTNKLSNLLSGSNRVGGSTVHTTDSGAVHGGAGRDPSSTLTGLINQAKNAIANTTVAKNIRKAITQAVEAQRENEANAGGYGTGGGGYNSGVLDDYEALLSEYKRRIDELENPKVWSADELAEHYGIKDLYDYERILKMYNDATDKYYTDALEEQRKLNDAAELSNSSYANNLLTKYLNSYKYAAPTAVGKGTLAANALSTLLGADTANEEASSNLNDIINSYKEKWDYEKATNESLARQEYDDMGKMLIQLGAAHNTADVQNYINALNAYDTAYAGIRNAQNNLASTAAAAYQNNAQAALAQNAYNNANSMAKYYQAYYGDNGNAWQKAYKNMLDDEAVRNTQKSSAN